VWAASWPRVGAAFALTSASPFPGLLAMIPVIGTTMVIGAGSRVLGLRLLVSLGKISYPLYLWHWPLLSFVAICNIESGFMNAAVVLASVVLAWLTSRYIEYPIRFGGLRPRGAAISAAGMLTVSLGAALIFYSGGLAVRFPAEIRPALATKYEFRGPSRTGRCWLDGDRNFDEYARECRDGEIVVWGDSMAALLATGLPKPYAQFTRGGCLPLLAGFADLCAKSNASIADEILRLKPRRVILFGQWMKIANWQSDPAKESLRNTLHKLRSGIDDVILIGPSPAWQPSLPEVVFKFWSEFGTLPDRLDVPPKNYRATDAVLRGLADSEDVRFISFFDALCNADGCLSHTPASRSQLLLMDSTHLTVHGAAYFTNLLGLARFDRPRAQAQ
jgi:hypothetical protein